mmetsp:Transcript_29099/g.59609  ORF Transcript_29099/g.59609 Transcript_29099/m.59609 type:complete len:408 (+) Transcript_29099:210-1433(+)
MAFYQGGGMQMRTSHEQMMRMSGGSQHSQHSQYSAAGSNYRPQPGAIRDSWDKRSSGGSLGSAARDSRGSRGSQDGLRMSGGPEMAGVGIFFQQEPTSGRVYVANIVEGGSADRSGVIRVNDVIAKVDDEDVQGQPLSTLRNLILGKQGTYVVLAFRRMTGTELYYYDVELVRGTPEYFESLKKSQVVADEKEKLLLQVRQQEQDILALRQQNMSIAKPGAPPAPAPAAPVPSSGDADIRRQIAAKSEEIKRVQQMLQEETQRSSAASSTRSDAEQNLVNLRAENKRLNESLQHTESVLEQMKTRYQTALAKFQQAKQQLPAAETDSAPTGSSSLEAENEQLRREIASVSAREKDVLVRLRQAAQAIEDVLRQNEINTKLMQEILPTMDAMHAQLFSSVGYDPAGRK